MRCKRLRNRLLYLLPVLALSVQLICTAEEQEDVLWETSPSTEMYVRSGPSANAAAIGIIHPEETVKVTEASETTWVKILFQGAGGWEEGFVNGSFLKDRAPADTENETPPEEDLTEQSPEQLREEEPQTEPEEETEQAGEDDTGEGVEYAAEVIDLMEPDTAVLKENDLIWAGDSRMVGMSWYEKTDAYLAAESIGIRWLEEEGEALIGDLLEKTKDTVLVIAFGINDYDESARYVKVYEDLTDQFGAGRVRLMSVNPVDEGVEAANCYQVKNQELEAFNEVLRDAFPEQFIDTYAFLMRHGFETTDGVHYTESTYRRINAYVHGYLN